MVPVHSLVDLYRQKTESLTKLSGYSFLRKMVLEAKSNKNKRKDSRSHQLPRIPKELSILRVPFHFLSLNMLLGCPIY